MRATFFMCILVVVFTSCEKDAGEGGTSFIEGQVYKIFTSQDPFSGEWDTAYFQKDSGKDVFIIYSDDEGSDLQSLKRPSATQKKEESAGVTET